MNVDKELFARASTYQWLHHQESGSPYQSFRCLFYGLVLCDNFFCQVLDNFVDKVHVFIIVREWHFFYAGHG